MSRSPRCRTLLGATTLRPEEATIEIQLDAPCASASSGDRLEELFALHARAVYRYARVQLGRDDAEDVTSEVFAVAVRRHTDVPGDALPWLLGVARRVIANTARARRRRAALHDRLHDALDGPGAGSGATDAVDELDRLRRALTQLSPRDQEVIALLTVGDLDNAGLAAVLGCSSNTAAARVSRARRRLRAVIELDVESVRW